MGRNKFIDYSTGKIYKIVDKDDKLLFAGSTTMGLTERLKQLKTEVKYGHRRRKFVGLNKHYWDSVKMILVKDFPCETKKELTTEMKKIFNVECKYCYYF